MSVTTQTRSTARWGRQGDSNDGQVGTGQPLASQWGGAPPNYGGTEAPALAGWSRPPHCGKAGPSGRIAALLPRQHHRRSDAMTNVQTWRGASAYIT